MKNVDLYKRKALKTLAVAGVTLPAFSAGIFHAHQQQNAHREYWLSAQGKKADNYGLGAITAKKEQAVNIPSGFRGHGICQHPTYAEKVVMSSRRPGITGLEVNLLSGETRPFNSPANHHMQGHSIYSLDGEWLFTSESDYTTGKGKIVVRDSTSLNVVNIFPSYGIGPHEIKMLPDSHILVVANGGLLTHPDSGRKVLNLDSMDSSLTYIDSRNGELISQHRVAETKASIRHFDIADDGTVAFGMQVQRQAMADNHLVALAGVHKPGRKDIQLLHAPETLTVALNDYMGSVAIVSEQRLAAFTSPRGDLAMFWNIDDGTLQGYHHFHDVCGLTINQQKTHFVLSNSMGKLRQIHTQTLQEDQQLRLDFPLMAWDNHMLAINLAG